MAISNHCTTGITSRIARDMLEESARLAASNEWRMTIAIVDNGGNDLALVRMDEASVVSARIARDKAYTAAVVGISTEDLTPLVQPGGELFGLSGADGGRLIVFGGGLPLLDGHGRIVGGVGASGGAVAEDVKVATAALRVWEAGLKSGGEGAPDSS